MTRAFEADLDLALGAVRKPIFNAAVVSNNIAASVMNALSRVKPSGHADRLAAEVIQLGVHFGNALAASLYSMESQSVTEAKSVLEAKIAELRAELATCPPSDMARALGLE